MTSIIYLVGASAGLGYLLCMSTKLLIKIGTQSCSAVFLILWAQLDSSMVPS